MNNTLMNYSSFFRRIIAGLIDLFVVAMIYALILNIEFRIWGYFYKDFRLSNIKYTNHIFLLMTLSATIIIVGYFSILESSKLRGGFGKVIMKICVINEFGYKINFSKSLLRAILKLISIILYISYLSIFFTRKKLTFYDFILKTYVINRQE